MRRRTSSNRRLCCLFGLSIFMVFGFLKNSNKAEAIPITGSATSRMESRLRGALWGFFAGDSLAAPSHWYYGGAGQVQRDYGRITGYVKPVTQLPGSILNKSNINGGGRGSFSKTKEGVSIIGDIINHGKRDYWAPSKQIHYHATLQAGENTLEAQIARVLMKSIVANGGKFNPNHFREAYMSFMTTPGSHNDVYASTCHRMFFANLVLKKLDPTDCPDNDMHNVDTIDGLILPTISALAAAASGGSAEDVADAAASTASVTRRSATLEGMSRVWSQLVMKSIQEDSDSKMVGTHLMECAQAMGLRSKPSARNSDQVTACYLSQSLPSTLDMVAKYTPRGDAWTGLLANANVGGENVHRGSILGAILGARASNERLPQELKGGLFNRQELEKEIDEFVKAVMK